MSIGSTYKYLPIVFGSGGDTTATPNTTQVDGSVSYQEGFGPPYSANPATNPSARDLDRAQGNGLWEDATGILQYWEQNGCPLWIAASDNGGTAFSYALHAIALYTDGLIYQSVAAANTTTPGTDLTKWVPIAAVGQQAGIGNYGIDTGAANAYVVALTPPVTAKPPSGLRVSFLATHASSGASTVDLGWGAVSLVNAGGGAITTEIPLNGMVTMVFDNPGNKLYLTGIVTAAALGTMASQNANAVAITGGSVTDLTTFTLGGAAGSGFPYWLHLGTNLNLGIQADGTSAVYISSRNDASNAFALMEIDASTLKLNSTSGGNVIVGGGGTGASLAQIILEGGSATNGGPALTLEMNSVISGYLGTVSSIIGGSAATDVVLYATSGNSVELFGGGNSSAGLFVSPGNNTTVAHVLSLSAYADGPLGVTSANVTTLTRVTSAGHAIPTAGTVLTVAHGIGARPWSVIVELVCVTNDIGWTAGQILTLNVGSQSDGPGLSYGVQVYDDATNVHVLVGSSGIALFNGSTGTYIAITAANWTMTVKAQQ